MKNSGIEWCDSAPGGIIATTILAKSRKPNSIQPNPHAILWRESSCGAGFLFGVNLMSNPRRTTRKQRIREWLFGFSWCTACKSLQPLELFCADRSRWNQLSSKCSVCRSGIERRGRMESCDVVHERGRCFIEPRDNDPKQARGRVNHLVNVGILPDPEIIPCSDCNHVGSDKRHEYDHYLGYAKENHEKVQVVCTTCHARRHQKTECKRGHEFNLENTGFTSEGRRFCKECRRIRDRQRVRPEGYWKSVNKRRRTKSKGDSDV